LKIKIDDIFRTNVEMLSTNEDVVIALVWNAVKEAVDLSDEGIVKNKAQFIAVVQDRILDIFQRALNFYYSTIRRQIEFYVVEVEEKEGEQP